jgi:hypothetical protein
MKQANLFACVGKRKAFRYLLKKDRKAPGYVIADSSARGGQAAARQVCFVIFGGL